MKSRFIILFFLTTCINSFGQNSTTTDLRILQKNHVFIEAFGTGFYGSMNYERVMPIGRYYNLGLRFGAGTGGDIFPIFELNSLFIGPRHFIDVGIGGIYRFDKGVEGGLPTFGFGYRFVGKKGLILGARRNQYYFLPFGITFGIAF